ncbi:transglycosylase domain-containing protein [Phormidium sp. FACHB-592]|uniref:Transglycosylase domain-containing protein n=1 Tax=Stenomitos frigidus AS-A4 TaxID=2933935 RepID=A0ABV0KGQ5_9CYAN|nr:transglycosylase domain-containing protein [Phormidium sp. FACHB-592]MBD2073734.1 transglycosylase domain-containing protein [Phormidium sp. FACHB-592]
MTPPPPRRSQTLVGAITQAVQTVQAKINFSKLKLKPNARVPELWVQEAGAEQAEVYPLLGDRYMLGRSSKTCDIVVRNPVVSQVHLSLNRDSQRQSLLSTLFRPPFFLKDENSTNGIYRGKRRVRSTRLRHKAAYTLGPPELAAAVRIQFIDPPPWYVQAVRYWMYGVGGVTALAVAGVLLEWQKFSVQPLPDSVQGPFVVLARDGQTPLSPVTNRTHTEFKNLSDFSPYLAKAAIASEDSRFYWHFGVDPIGTLRALVANVRGGEIREGGSTLTQQLARSLLRQYVGTQDSAGRKLREAAVALKLETFYSKDFLMLTYLNRVYLGNEAYGFEDAAQFYLGKSAKDLTLSEAATLVGILPAPNSFNPVRDYNKAIELRDGVLQRMAELNLASAEEIQRARRSRVDVNPKAKAQLDNVLAPYYYSYVFTELQQLLGSELAEEGNFIIETGLDLKLQSRAEASLQEAVNNAGASAGFSQGAIVTIDSQNGEVLALVGGVDYKKSQFNRASQALRQPGSTFKVFAYTTAFEQGISPGTAYSCAPLDWQGQSFAGCRTGGGSLDISTGLAQSENVIALRVAQAAGLDNTIRTAQRMGIRSTLKATPGLVLGESEVTPLELTGAFSIFANRGVSNPPRAIRRILDGGDCKIPKDVKTCRIIYSADRDPQLRQPVLSPDIAETMTSLMQGVVRGGTGRAAAIGQGEAGKTGTTNDNVDLWFVGYIPGSLVTGVWLGNDNNSPTSGSSGEAAQLWGNYMSKSVR